MYWLEHSKGQVLPEWANREGSLSVTSKWDNWKALSCFSEGRADSCEE